jgi:chromatin remodeling complex protein RSC6
MAKTKKRTTAKKKKTAPRKSAVKKKTVAGKKAPTRATKAAPKRKAKKVVTKAKTKRKPNAAFMKPLKPSPALAAVIGPALQPRTAVTKKIWDYIKKHKLQDSVNRRMINADEKLKTVFGGKKKVSMFEMTKLVAGHLK